jgi:hypothetical protein
VKWINLLEEDEEDQVTPDGEEARLFLVEEEAIYPRF